MTHRKRRFVAGLLFLAVALAPVVAVSGPLEEGRGAFERGDYAAALRLLGPLAERGDAEAQSRLGVMYAAGRGVPQDYVAAVKWYRLAAEQGNAKAQHNLGVMYDKGRGVRRDLAEALK